MYIDAFVFGMLQYRGSRVCPLMILCCYQLFTDLLTILWTPFFIVLSLVKALNKCLAILHLLELEIIILEIIILFGLDTGHASV